MKTGSSGSATGRSNQRCKVQMAALRIAVLLWCAYCGICLISAVPSSSSSSRAVTAAGTKNDGNGDNKVYLRSVTALVFSEKGRTRARSGLRRPQLACVGGSAAGFFWGGDRYPRLVQCENIGWDGASIQWRCHADLKEGLEFGDTVVTCEGYNSPHDEYIYRGSCRLEYTLNYATFQISFVHVIYASFLALAMIWFYYQSRFWLHSRFYKSERKSGQHHTKTSSTEHTYMSTGESMPAYPATGKPLE